MSCKRLKPNFTCRLSGFQASGPNQYKMPTKSSPFWDNRLTSKPLSVKPPLSSRLFCLSITTAMLKKSPLSTPSPALDSHPRNPRVHRQSGIPSINRPKCLNGAGVSHETNTPGHTEPLTTKTGYQHPSRDPKAQSSTPTSYHRLASIPQPVIQAQIDIDGDRIARGSLISPPIVDFTRFDDRYRGPRSGNFEGLVTKTKQTNRSISVGVKPILKRNPHSSGLTTKTNTTDMILDPHPASVRKPDPRLIISALEAVVLDSSKKPADVLDVYDLLGMHQLDQLDFEERDIARESDSQTYPRGEMGKDLNPVM